jgi:hypothetical protein
MNDPSQSHGERLLMSDELPFGEAMAIDNSSDASRLQFQVTSLRANAERILYSAAPSVIEPSISRFDDRSTHVPSHHEQITRAPHNVTNNLLIICCVRRI